MVALHYGCKWGHIDGQLLVDGRPRQCACFWSIRWGESFFFEGVISFENPFHRYLKFIALTLDVGEFLL